MNKKRLWHTLRLWTILSGTKRAKYMKKKHIFASMGDKCIIMDRKIPLYPNLIKLGNNVNLASDVTFVTHDITHKMLNNAKFDAAKGKTIPEKLGCIEIGDNVFIGTGVKILYNVKIGSNVIIGSGSIVTKDIPDGSIAVGVPAKVISDMDSYISKRLSEKSYDNSIKPRNQEVGEELSKFCWKMFEESRL